MGKKSDLTRWIDLDPKKSEQIDEQEIKRELLPLKSGKKTLKTIFREIHNYLYVNSNLSRNERLGKELLKIVLAKHFDEKWTFGIFQNLVGENKKQFPNKLRKFFDENLVPFLIEKGVYNNTEKIELDDTSLSYIGSILQEYSFIENPVDSLGAAFEVFAEGALAGDKGQFFTPLEIVRMSVAILNPRVHEKIIDPACGSGGFINYTFRWIAASQKLKSEDFKTLLEENLFGVDKDPDLISTAKGFAEVMDINSRNFLHRDSLTILSKKDENLLGKFDVVLTNPPFGTKIKVQNENILKHFDLAYVWKFNKGKNVWEKKKAIQEREPQILFLELCIKLLKPGGRLAIVLPDGIFGNPSRGWVRQYILSKTKVLAVIDCPQDSFMPHTHTKTSVLFLEKVVEMEYDIFFAIAKDCGHDSRGITILNDDGTVKEDFSKVQREYKLYKEGKLKQETNLGYLIKNRELVDTILTPNFYDMDLRTDLKKLRDSHKYLIYSMGELEAKGILTIRNARTTTSKVQYGEGNIPFIRTTDIGNGEILEQNVHSIPYEIYLEYKDQQNIKPKDIIFVKDGTYRIGNSALLLESDCEIILQSHFKIITVNENDLLNPFLLYFLLQLDIVKRQISRNTFVQTTISTIGDRIKNIKLPIPKDEKLREQITDETRQALTQRNKLKLRLRESLNKFNKEI